MILKFLSAVAFVAGIVIIERVFLIYLFFYFFIFCENEVDAAASVPLRSYAPACKFTINYVMPSKSIR